MARSNRSQAKPASQQPATGTLIVRVVAVGGDPVDPADLPDRPALPAGEAVVGDQTEELRDGAARFEGLPAGEHAVEVRPGQGFAAPDRLFVLDEQGRPAPADGPVAVGPGEEVTVVAACRRTHVRVAGSIELQGAGKARPRRADWSVPLEVHRPGAPRTTVTSDKGDFEAIVEADGPVELVAPSHIDAGGRRFVPQRPRTTVEPDGEPVRLTYHEAGAIRVAGSLEDEDETRLVPGVHFTLRDAEQPNEVLRDATSSWRRPVVVFDDLVPGGYVVVADDQTVKGFPPLQLVESPGRRSVTVEAGKTTDLTDAYRFEPEPATVTGQVRAAAGGGLAGITVELRDPAGEEPARTDYTDDDGRYLFADVEPGPWRVQLGEQVVDASGAAWRPRPPDDGERSVTALPGRTVEADDIVLDPAPGRVRGRVEDDDHHGVPGIEVVLEPADGGAAARTRLSDLNGWFVFESVEPGRYILRLDRPIQVGGELLEPVAGDSDQREVEVVSGATAGAPTFRLERRRRVGTVSGRLRDGDGDGVAGVPVTLFADGRPPQVEHTDARGVYTFRQVAPGVQLVSVPTPATAGGVDWRPVPPDAGQRTVNVRAGATTQVPDIELEPVPVLRTVSGSVVVNGTPNGLAGVKLEVRPAAGGPPLITVTTGQGGGFSVRVPAGTWAIAPAELPIRIGTLAFRPLPPGDPGTRVVQVGTKNEVADPLVVEPVAAPVAITGRVVDAGVTPAAGLQGVRVRLRPAAGGSARFAVTGPGGGFTFEDAQNGSFVVELEQSPFELAGDQWEPVIGDSGTRQVTVQGGPVDVGSLLVQQERHRIVGTVTRPDGSAAAFLPIRLLDELGQLVLEVTTDFDGRYDADVQREGRFILEVRQDGRITRRPVTVESDVRLDLTIDDDVVGGGAATAATQDFAAFPVLTEAVTPAQLPAAGGPISSIGQTVEGALREALGWRPRPSDPRAFNAALLQSFSRVEVEGHTEATWTPRTYAAQVQADLGAITGAQASLYSRARVALDAALPLLDGLRPLDPAADEQDTEAIRSIIRSELIDLVTELGVEGGPRISRVDDLLDLLLGPAVARAGATATTPAEGQLGELLRRFGLDADRVETVDEEEVLTNALILVDYVREIDTSWQQRRGIFDPTSTQTPFLGTQLVLLSRSLAVTAESVTEVGFTLDSVFLGAAERLAIRLTFTDIDQPEGLPLKDSKGNTITVPGNTPSILLEELLRWVERVASEEGPRLLQDGGKDGASALTPVLDRLRMLVRGSLVTTGTGPSKGLQSPESVPAGYATARVQRALSELAKYLDDAADLARGIQRSPVRR